MNPCPCGRGGERGCLCPQHVLEAYRRKISGPITDRLDIWLNVHKIDYEKMTEKISSGEDSSTIRNRVIKARTIQSDRYKKFNINKSYNGEMNASDIEKLINLDDVAKKTIRSSAEKMELSGRSFHRILKVAQTISDLGNRDIITEPDILEALQYRRKMTD